MKRSRVRYILAILNTIELVFVALFTVPMIAIQALFAVQIADIFFGYFTIFPDYQDADIFLLYLINGVAIFWLLWTIVKLYKRFPYSFLWADIVIRVLFIVLCGYLYFNPFVTPLISVSAFWMLLMILFNSWALRKKDKKISIYA